MPLNIESSQLKNNSENNLLRWIDISILFYLETSIGIFPICHNQVMGRDYNNSWIIFKEENKMKNLSHFIFLRNKYMSHRFYFLPIIADPSDNALKNLKQFLGLSSYINMMMDEMWELNRNYPTWFCPV